MATTRDTARKHESEALEALANFGLLTSRQVGTWVFGSAGNENTRQAKTQRLLARLEKRGEIIRRGIGQAMKVKQERDYKPAPGSQLVGWVLSQAGAERVNDALEDQGFERWAHHGRDLGLYSAGTEKHRVVTDFGIAKEKEGCLVFGKAALRAGVISKDRFGDCDAVVMKPGSGGSYTTSAVVFIGDAYSSTLERVRKLKSRVGADTELVLLGEPRWTKEVRKALGQ